MDKLTVKIIAALREGKQKYAAAAMDFPKSDPFEHGVQVGVYRGIDMALSTIESLLHEDEQEEARH